MISGLLLQALDAPMQVAGQPVLVGASIGTVFVPDRPTEVDELMHAADTAMYRNKAARGARARGQRFQLP
jgi:predicted signal transduction protein with EAL and GGDEF domain